MINDLSGDARKLLLDVLDTATAEKPATRQTLAVAGNVERAQVGELLSELRLQGYLILETEAGCWLGTSFDEYKQWRSTMLIPTMLLLLQIDQAMARAALMQFGAGRAETA